jgi:hypothetical protein
MKEIILLVEHWLTSGWYCHVVQMDTLECWILLELWKAFGHVAATSGRMQAWTVDNDRRPDACMNRLDESLGSNFFWLENCTKSSLNFENCIYEDSKINDIPNYVARLHTSDFVQQNAANHKLTNSPFGQGLRRNCYQVFKIKYNLI